MTAPMNTSATADNAAPVPENIPLSKLRARLEDVISLRETNALLKWDMETYMPEAASNSRARHIATISKLAHSMFIDEETGDLIQAAGESVGNVSADSFEASLVRVARKDYQDSIKLPAAFVAEMSKTTALAHNVWVEAREKRDFALYAPTLQKIFDLKRQQADLQGFKDHPYDALLDNYEPGLTHAQVANMFAELRRETVPLVAAIARKVKEKADVVSDAPLHGHFDIAKQREFAEKVIRKFGFDFARGRQDVTVHPFCTGFSRDDIRITTRFDPTWLNPALFGTLHEAGHGMYEQGTPAEFEGTVLGGGVSLGVHESQSRLWENLIGRSRAFWKAHYLELQATFPDALGNVNLETFYRAINKVEPSFIRVEADEVTYNLHVMIRFEIESEILEGKLAIIDIPQAWNAKSQAYLGITPSHDADGCLQDIHWAMGLVGYFPTYSIGNLLSVQLFQKAIADRPQIPTEIEQGEFSSLLGWLRENVHQHGRKYQPNELIQRATGEPLTAKYYVAYLQSKFADVYGL